MDRLKGTMVPMTNRNNIFNPKLKRMGDTLRILRIKNGLTIARLSELTNISEKMIGNYENARNLMTIETIIKLYYSEAFEDKDRSLIDYCTLFIVDIFENNEEN